MPAWILAIAVIVVLQTVSATLGRLVPIAGPAFTVEFGWDEAWVGYLSAANIVGALFMLTAGIGAMHRLGGVRALQLSLLIGAASLLLYLVPSIALALIASVCVGLGNGAANPAGSEVLTALHAAGAPQPRVLDQAGRRAARRRGRRSRDPAADRGDGLAARRASSSPRACIAAILLTWPFQSRIDPPREQRMRQRLISFRLYRHPGAAALAVARRPAVAGLVGRLPAGDPAGRLGHVPGDLSGGGARPVAAARRVWCSR